MSDAIDAFRNAALTRGLVLPMQVRLGKLSDCGTTEKPRGKDGRYILHVDAFPAGGFQNMADGEEWENWKHATDREPTELERRERAERVRLGQLAADEERVARYAKAKARAELIWAAAVPVVCHPYLNRKGIRPNGVRLDPATNILIPLYAPGGELTSLQSISPEGEKLFLPGGRVKGCAMPIGLPTAVVCIAEGFASAASVHEATGYMTLAAMSCGNIRAVAYSAKGRFPKAKLVICADDDWQTPGNPGLTKAREVAAELRCPVSVPAKMWTGGSDFNDLQREEGVEAVRGQIEYSITTGKECAI
jgi:putative DNA primase/helicase